MRTCRSLLAAALLCSTLGCPEEPDLNDIGEIESESIVLDMAMPMASYEIDACSTESNLWIEVRVELDLPQEEQAAVGVTLQHDGRTVTGFADGFEGLRVASAKMHEVRCGDPISFTIERLDGGLMGEVGAAVFVTGDADGIEGSTEVEVRG